MATSGTWDFSLTAGELIATAFEDLGEITPGQTVPTEHATLARRRLNMIVKQYQGRSDGAPGLKIHTRQRITLLLAKGQQSYLIGPGSSDARASTALGRTTVSIAYASGTSLDVAALTDTTSYPGSTITMTASDIIGVVLDDGTISYTTISAASGTPITLGGALSGAASAGNAVYWFTSRAQRFPNIEGAVLRNANFNDTPLDIYTDVRQYEFGVASKQARGSSPTAMLVEPLRTQTRVTLDVQPTDVNKTVVLTVFYPAEDYDSDNDDVAFPQEALRFLSWELAFALSTSIGKWSPEMDRNRNEARAMYLNLNPENSVEYFQVGGL